MDLPKSKRGNLVAGMDKNKAKNGDLEVQDFSDEEPQMFDFSSEHKN